MKKNLLFLAAAAVALASCSSDETTEVNQGEANVISFRSLNNNVTRAVEKTGFANDDVIDVWAVYNDGTPSKYFQSNFSYNSSTGFTSTNTYYWPDLSSTNTLTFFAVHNADAIQSAAGVASYTPNAAASSQKDVIVSYGVANNSTSKSTQFPLTFNHALSEILVKVKSTQNLKIDITGVRIGYVKTASGSVTFTDNTLGNISWSADYATPTGSATDASANMYEQTFSAVTLTGVTPGGSEETIGNPWMLIPQTMKTTDSDTNDNAAEYSVAESDGATATATVPKFNCSFIALKMSIHNWTGSAEGAELLAEQWCYWPITTAWTPGKRYTYTINAAHAGFQPTDQNNNINITDDDRVLNLYPIEFATSCSISAWSDASGVAVP